MSVVDLQPGEEVRFTVKLAGTALSFIRRPVSIAPREGARAFVDGVDEQGREKRAFATFKNGRWCKGTSDAGLDFTPRVWTVCAEMEAAGGI